eukprot:5426187-Alexandrium_andersonii.AAC.1
MSASLVGSEMCIRDSPKGEALFQTRSRPGSATCCVAEHWRTQRFDKLQMFTRPSGFAERPSARGSVRRNMACVGV